MNIFKKISLFVLSIVTLFSFNFVFADDLGVFDNVVGDGATISTSNGTAIIKGDSLSTKTVPEIIGTIIKVILGLSGVIALVYVVWGGVEWIISQGDSTKIKKAKDRMVAAAIGILVIAVSYAITDFIINQVKFIAG